VRDQLNLDDVRKRDTHQAALPFGSGLKADPGKNLQRIVGHRRRIEYRELNIAVFGDEPLRVDIAVPFEPLNVYAIGIGASKGRGIANIARRHGTALSQERKR
jgi:hypothetical protein